MLFQNSVSGCFFVFPHPSRYYQLSGYLSKRQEIQKPKSSYLINFCLRCKTICEADVIEFSTAEF